MAMTEALASSAERNLHPPGMVVLPCHDLARYHHFTQAMVLLDVPDGTEFSINRSASITQNFNLACETFMEMPDLEWMWIIGDDHTFERDVIMRLLAHDVDIVVPLCTRRGPPFTLVAFDHESTVDGVPFKDEHGRQFYHCLQYEDLPDHGLVELVAAGSAGMLVKRGVLEAMENPWFFNSDGITTDEDVQFCLKARELGFKVWLDVDTSIGHLGVLNAWVGRKDGEWGLVLDFQGQGTNQIFIPNGMHPEAGGAVREGVADVGS